MIRNIPQKTKSVLFFCALVLLEAALTVWLAASHRSGGHDTFQHFNDLYFFLDHVRVYGEVPQWVPFILHGMPATQFTCLQDGIGIFFRVLFLLKGLVPDVNVLTLFNIDVFFNQFVLLLGTWLWSRRFISSAPARFFTAAGVLGSSIWFSQVYFNFAFFCALPLVFYLLHTFWDEGRWGYLLAAVSLWVLHSLTVHAYFIPVTSWIIFVYVLSYFIFNAGELKEGARRLSFRGPAPWLCLAGIIACLWLFALLFLARDPQIVSITPGRAADGTVPLSMFLDYDRSFGPHKWAGLLLRQSWPKDLTFYAGFLTVAFAFYALLFGPRRKVLPLVLVIVLMGAFSLSSPMTSWAYRFWPLMKFFRHIGLVASVLRVFFCVIAGIGLECFFSGEMAAKRKTLFCLAAFLVFFHLAFFLGWVNGDLERIESVRKIIWDTQLRLMPSDVSFQFSLAAVLCFVIAVFWLVVFLFRREINKNAVMAFILIVQVLDLYGYKFVQARWRTFRLSPEQYRETSFQAMPYWKNREEKPWVNSRNPRVRAFQGVSSQHQGITYCSLNAFVFVDETGSSHVSHVWAAPVGKYFRVYGGQDLDETAQPPPGYSNRRLIFPLTHPAALKISGVTRDKVQFFSGVYALDEKKTAALITDSAYTGDMIFVSPRRDLKQDWPVLSTWRPDIPLDTNRRLDLPYTVRAFSANHLELDVTVPGTKGAWLMYADTWHPQWTAAVNGQRVPVLRANLAYKAVPLRPGHNLVRFSFYSRQIAFLQFLTGLLALGWTVGIIFLLRKL